MMKLYPIIIVFLSFSALAQEYEIIHVEGQSIPVQSNTSARPSPILPMVIDKVDCRKVPTDCVKLIYTYIELDDGKKLSSHLRNYPESIQLQFQDWSPAHWAVFLSKRNALTSIMAYLMDHDMLDQIYQRGDENGPPEFVSSVFDLNPKLVDEVLSELQIRAEKK